MRRKHQRVLCACRSLIRELSQIDTTDQKVRDGLSVSDGSTVSSKLQFVENMAESAQLVRVDRVQCIIRQRDFVEARTLTEHVDQSCGCLSIVCLRFVVTR